MFKKLIFVILNSILTLLGDSQIINYVNNGDFENCVNCTTPPYVLKPKFWGPIDTNSHAFFYCGVNSPLMNLPGMANGYQFPKGGDKIIISTIYCGNNTCSYVNSRNYPRNRLKLQLKANTEYCVRFYIVNHNKNSIAIDAFGAYFGDESIDTINYSRIPLTYLTPQIQNPINNIITDTLNWVPITGTFVANGTEKYMILGNFRNNNSTNTVLANPEILPGLATDVFYDDVSVIELNAPAYAGPDVTIQLGDSVNIGSPRDFATDEVCMWYHLPNDSVPIDTVAGLWVKPATTATYMVRQQLWCSSVKWDTVVVFIDTNPVGFHKLQFASSLLRVSPVPADEMLHLSCGTNDMTQAFNSIIILNNLGQVIRNKEIIFEKNAASIKTDDLPEGVYTLQLRGAEGVVNKRFVVAR